MKRIISVILVTLLIFSFVGCGSNKADSDTASADASKTADTAKEEKVELNIACIPGPVSARLKSDAEAFMGKNPGVTVNVNEFPEDTYQSQYPQIITEPGNKPDAAWFWCTMDTYNKVAESGALEPLDDLYASEGWDKILPPATIGAYTSPDGHKYGVNTDIVWVQVIYMNKKIFNELGIEKPKTYDELFAASKKIKEAGYVPLTSGINIGGIGSQAWLSILSGLCDPSELDKAVELKYNEVDYTRPEILEAYKILQKMGKEVYVEGVASMKAEDARSLFVQGKAAMYADGSWVASNAVLFKEVPEDFELDFMFFPQAKPEINSRPLILSCNGLTVMKDTGKEDWAKKFVAFVMTYDRQKSMAANKFFFPSRTDMKPEDIEPLGELNVAMNEEMNKIGRAPYLGLPYPITFVETARKNAQQVIAGTMSPEEAVKSMIELSKK